MAKKPRVLTDTFITGLKPAPKGQRESFADALVPGLKIRVTDRGAKSFILWRRFPPSKNPAARSLGAVGALTLTEARDKARRWLELIAQGKDPEPSSVTNAKRNKVAMVLPLVMSSKNI